MSRKLPSLENFNFTMKKCRRMKNWTQHEKELLFVLVEPHIDIIESKEAQLEEKTKLWKMIHSKLNKEGPSHGAIDRIKQQWHRMKVLAKLEMLRYHTQIKQVGLINAARCQPSPLNIKIWRLCLAPKHPAAESIKIEEGLQISVQVIPEIKIEVTSDVENNDADDNSENQEIEMNEDVNEMTINKESDLTSNNSQLPINITPTIDPLASSTEQFHVNLQHRPSPLIQQPSNKYPTQPSVMPITQPPLLIRQTAQDSSAYFLMNQREHNMKVELLKTQLEVAVLQRQTATHELRTAAAKYKLVEEQASHVCHCQVKMVGERGSGAGKGGGGGGSIREAGGSFGKMESAHEDQYFYNIQKEQLSKLKEGLHDEISFHEEQIKRHQEAINRHKKRMDEMEKH